MKTFVIVIKGNSFSESIGQITYLSALSHGFEAEIFDAVTPKDWQTRLAPFGIKGGSGGLYEMKTGNVAPGQIGCRGSHYLLWRKCIELDEPIVILEHDCIVIAPIPECQPLKNALQRKNCVIQLNARPDLLIKSKNRTSYEPEGIELLDDYTIKTDRDLQSTVSYVVTPSAAKLLSKRSTPFLMNIDGLRSKKRFDTKKTINQIFPMFFKSAASKNRAVEGLEVAHLVPSITLSIPYLISGRRATTVVSGNSFDQTIHVE